MVKTGMQNIEDIARIEYVLKNYDNMKNGSTIFATQNSDTSQEKTVILTKKIDGTYYVEETVPDSYEKLQELFLHI